MYKDYSMNQFTLPMETSILIPTNNISRYVNEIVETIPDNEFDELKHHRGATSYHPKMITSCILSNT
ncbi:transposase [Staphylococcus sp. HMSC077C04]|nr:transposase [Staphylococcus lugdunensis]OFN88233.1 transposase [Staphylococcus sp. HMSC077C04]OHP12847.1 transposase [Staphylococcus sp. HMSC058E03]OHP17669.1 transposase [Staphylococcus sp. HMSC060A04]OHP56014.1 transposase [Staphylococcus sp. HMSC061C10]OHP99545.1 transposase [Staphylococcus sp. HMSC063F10]OHQ05642.1 transposase [Staphylococcus sp. HMSC064A09]OHS56143.1 transposase [Staphylococcus sp. HMSC70A05]OHS70084.1 transposase [Staphylococcus sp. HMSC74A08]